MTTRSPAFTVRGADRHGAGPGRGERRAAGAGAVPALCALIATLVLLWRSRRRPTDVALWSALAGIGIDGLAQDIDHFRHVWVLLGLLGSGSDRQRADPSGGETRGLADV